MHYLTISAECSPQDIRGMKLFSGVPHAHARMLDAPKDYRTSK